MTFTVYLAVYLIVATALSLGAIELLSDMNNGYYELEVTLDNGLIERGFIDSGPYIYDPETRELVPASELALPGDSPLAVFIATGEWETGSDYMPEEGRNVDTLYATLDMVRSGQVQLYDWGLNYNEWYPQEEVLEVNGSISADDLARYDELSRTHRTQVVDLFDSMTGANLEETFGAGRVSNTAYYAASQRPAGPILWLLALATGLAPVISYGGLGWIAFRRFYRVHIAEPLAALGEAADRIGGRDLDFSIERVRGRELGRLSCTLENMRGSLLEAQRELWRTAEGRRRLNAAFAHDLRTPITVLKGTIEMAQMRIRRGDAIDEGSLEALAAQVARLERYATAMGGLSKLEDRPVEREPLAAQRLIAELEAHAREVVQARGDGLELRVVVDEPRVDGGAPLTDGGAPVFVDVPLVEEVLDNLLGNACGHARAAIDLEVTVREDSLSLCIADDGPGFTPEALRRGRDPFYSENKSAEHFGLGLNVSSILCELHGGSLELANGAEGGARVTASFAAVEV